MDQVAVSKETLFQSMQSMVEHLASKKRVLFLTTSNRWPGGDELPKSSQVALELARRLGASATVIDIAKLNIYPCEGNVSGVTGNSCGVKDAVLKDAEKNPSGCHRCWASINNPDDELWKVSKVLLESDAVVFFGSVRWGQMNAMYQKLIERLTWLENRHSTLGEENILKNIDAGIIAIGHNWHAQSVVALQKRVLSYFGFPTPDVLSWHWQYTLQPEDETAASYEEAAKLFPTWMEEFQKLPT